MKTVSYILMAVGVLLTLTGLLVFTNLKLVNPADSHPWSIYINGIRSFPWLQFTGGLFIALGMIFNIATWHQKKYRVR